MCALFGWLDYKGIVPYKVLKKLTQLLANAAEERGTDAAGISYVKDGRGLLYIETLPSLTYEIPAASVPRSSAAFARSCVSFFNTLYGTICL